MFSYNCSHPSNKCNYRGEIEVSSLSSFCLCCISVSQSLFLFLYVCLTLCFSMCLFVYMSLSLFDNLSLLLLITSLFYLSASASVCLSVITRALCLPLCLGRSVCLAHSRFL